MGIKMGIKKTVEVDAKVLRIHCKVRDEFTASIYDADGEELGGQDDGYVPDFMPGDNSDGSGSNYGDYLILNIDLETGHVLNWRKPTAAQLAKFINREDD